MSIFVYYNPLDKACKSIVGGIQQNRRVRFNVFLLNEERKGYRAFTTPSLEECKPPEQDGFFMLGKDGEEMQPYPMQKTAYGWTITVKIKEIGLYFYSFKISESAYISCKAGEIGQVCDKNQAFILTVYSKDYKTPDWFKGGVMYQIFPDRFARDNKCTMPDIKGRIYREDWGNEPSYRPNEYGKVLNNDFFGGNFKGIMAKLPYLKSLGVTIIYLNPIFEAASNHRYDTGNYLKIDPYLGTEEDFAEFVKAAKNQGIRVILDGVFNHTGDDSVYFNKYGRYDNVGAYQSQESPYTSWYNFERFPDKYESWWGIDILPQVNENDESYQKFIFNEGGVLKKWLSYGIGGYRLDVADELPDEFLINLRKSVKDSNENAVIIGEVWEDASTKVAYSKRRGYLHGYELDSVMNYPWKEAIISYIFTGDSQAFLRTIYAIINHYPKQTLDCLMNILGTHDTPRILTVLGGIKCKNKDEMASKKAFLSEKDKENAIKKLKMAAVLQFTLPGVPSVYYGDENAMEGDIDPFCRRCFDWAHLNEDLIKFYASLGKMREDLRNFFKDGEFRVLQTDGGLMIYAREKSNDSVTVFVNNSSKTHLLNLPYKMQDCLTGVVFENTMQILPYSYGVLKKVKLLQSR